MPMPHSSGKRIFLNSFGKRYRLDADAAFLGEANLLELFREALAQHREEGLRRLGARLELDAGVDVLGVLPEDDHVHLLRVLHRAGDAPEVPDRPEADVEVEQLAERHVQAPDASTDRRGQRALDAHQVGAERLDGLVGQPVLGLLERLLAGEDLHPGHAPLAAVGLGDRRVEDRLGGPPDVPPRPVTLDERDDWPVGHSQCPPGQRDAVTCRNGVAHDGLPSGIPLAVGGYTGRDNGSATRNNDRLFLVESSLFPVK